MPRIYLIVTCLVLLALALVALYTKIPNNLKVMDIEGHTETSFSWPKGSYNSMLVGFARPTGDDVDVGFKGTLTISTHGKVVCASPIDLMNSSSCNWLDREGLTGVILNLSDDSGLDEIAAGTACDVSIEIDGVSGGPYSLWITYLTTVGPTLATDQDLTICCSEPRLLSVLK